MRTTISGESTAAIRSRLLRAEDVARSYSRSIVRDKFAILGFTIRIFWRPWIWVRICAGCKNASPQPVIASDAILRQ